MAELVWCLTTIQLDVIIFPFYYIEVQSQNGHINQEYGPDNNNIDYEYAHPVYLLISV